MKYLSGNFKKIKASSSGVDRDARYVITLIWSTLLFILMTIQALNARWFDAIEIPIFHFFNNLPHWLGSIMYFITQFGSLGGLVVWMGIAWYLINRKAALTVLLGGTFAWIAAKIAKADVHRGRPQEFIHHISLFHDHIYSGYGFPSGHASFSAACITVLYFQLRPKYRKYLLLIGLLVGISRMYLGAHFPLDIVGGWALGIMSGSIAVLLVGTSARKLSAQAIKRNLKRKGFDVKSAQFANLDARGSRPIMIEDADGKQYFGKIVGDQEHAADWLFKIYRFFRYKNLQAEEPYLNGRRSIELESFANLWARRAGVRSPGIINIFKIGRHWLLVQEKIDATPLNDLKRIKTDSLADAWRQVMKLHDSNMAHRDLRASNVMIDSAGKAWIIDYGFAEAAPNAIRKSMDIAELLMSMSLAVGVERTVETAMKVVDKTKLKHALRYVHASVFSGATNQALKSNKPLLKELQTALKDRLNVSHDIVAPDIVRLDKKKVLTMLFLVIFAYIIIPQFAQFKNAFGALEDVRLGLLLPIAVFSALSYVAAGLVYVALASVPLRVRQATLVQVASSFMSKIVPGGLGSTSLNVRYLTKAGLDPTEAAAVIFGQNFIGIVMFVIPLALFLLIDGQSIGSLFTIHIKAVIIYGVLTTLLVAILAVSVNQKLRTKAQHFIVKFIAQLREMSTSPRELAFATVASLAITASYITCLYFSIHAFHATLSVAAAILIYASAVIAKSAVPTPGGLGPVEVAMSAALIGAGVVSGQALAIVILYRLATFWLPVPFSFFAYRYISNNNIV